MRTPTAVSVSVLVALVAGCDSPPSSIAAPRVAVRASQARGASDVHMVPFRTASYVFHSVSAAPEPGCNATGEQRIYLAGEGTATRLGRYTVTFSFCARPGIRLTDGEGTFVAANGDLLYFTFFGTATFVPPVVVPFTSYATFTGGTGRFENATGSAVVSGTVDVTKSENEASWVGTISSVGSSKP